MKYICPHCKKPVNENEKTIPFCSKRCKMIDLGTWLDEGYKFKGIEGDADNALKEDDDGYPG